MLRYFLEISFRAVCIICFFCSHSSAQPDPITIQFVEAQPLWEHLTYDTSFYVTGNPSTLNKYNSAHPDKCYRFNDDLFIYSSCVNYNADLYGYVLEKLNIETGDIDWQSYNTYYNNGIQDIYKNLYLRPDGKLEMVGIKSHGPYAPPILGYWNVGGGTSDFVRKIIDYKTGALVQTIIGRDSVEDIVPQYLNFYRTKLDSTYLVSNVIGHEVNDTILFGYEFYTLNEGHNLTDPFPIANILFETSTPGDLFSYGHPQFTERINDSTLLGLILKDKMHPEKLEAQLMWMDIKDLGNINILKRINIENLIPSKEHGFLYFRFRVVNDLIYITEPYKENNVRYTFLTCLDLEGNLVHFIPKCIVDNRVYTYISLAYAGDKFDYFVGFPSRTGRKGFDILKLGRNAEVFEYVSSLTSANPDENFSLQLEVNNLYDDGLFIIGAFTEKIGPVENSALKYYCFRGSDLGMDLSTSTLDRNITNHVSAYPNPTNGVTNLHFEQLFSGEIKVVDVTGKEFAAYYINGVQDFKLHLENYPAGIYYINISSNKAGLNRSLKIIITH